MNAITWTPLIQTERTNIYITHPDMAETVLAYKIRNHSRFQWVEPQREPSYFELTNTTKRIEFMQKDMQENKSLCLIATLKDEQKMIASINFTNFVYGVFQACNLGYSIDQDYERQGLMYEIVKPTIEYVREKFKIHRIMANYVVDNQRSSNLLAKLGFEKEGYARAYVKINGSWQDHILNSLIFDKEDNS